MTTDSIEEEVVLSRDPARECSRGFSSSGADACSFIKRESGEKNDGQVVFEKRLLIHFKDTCDQTLLYQRVVVEASEDLLGICNLGSLSSRLLSFLEPLHALTNTKRVSLPVNLRRDKACNLIVALFPLRSRTFTPPVPEDYIPRPVVQSHPTPPSPGRHEKD